MHETSYSDLGISLYHEQMANGLEVFLIPKAGFQQTFATFSTHYGSIDNTFRKAGDAAWTEVPDGIAHFLEHKMFEKESGDIFPVFAQHGASANAFTTFDMTSYLFSCTMDLRENTETLLNFVQDPYFSKESVDKEKGIIGQEIRMYDDNPDTRVFYGLLQAMYKAHPVRLDIAGTVESIAKITPDTLYRCYHTFYHPGNMVFVAAGGFSPEEMMKWIRSNQLEKTFEPPYEIERAYAAEPEEVHKRTVVTPLEVNQARCLMGWKDPAQPFAGVRLLERELLTGVVLDVLFGRSSELYDQWIERGLIDQQFSWEYERTETYGYALIGGNTSQPEALMDAVQKAVAGALRDGLSEDAFERCRNKSIGRFMAALDSPAYVARNYPSYFFKGVDMFDSVGLLTNMTLKQANERLQQALQPERMAVSLVASQANDSGA